MSTLRQDLKKALKNIDRPGSFCASGSLPAVLPGLEVAKLGPIGLPLSASQAELLKAECEQAPYGKGEATLVDTSVRRVWHLSPDRFSLTNPGWETFMEQVVASVQEALGLEKQKLESHIYDLLLYEPGSFFLPHRDSEKLDRMVATLVVVLPSSYQGGELIVRHEGQEQVIDFSGANKFDVHYAAFYCDCEHEIRPLREGYRLCLVYNLALTKKTKTPLTAPRASEHIEAISKILRGWEGDQDVPQKLAITLDHQYTKDGLTWDALKGVDRARANVLIEAARQAGCCIYLTLLTFHEVGSAEETGGGDYYGWDDDDYEEDEDEEDEEEESGDYKMIDVIDQDLGAELWLDPEGTPLGINDMYIDEDEVLDPKALQSVKPEEEFEGYTGNAGMTLDRWYRHAAIFLWPASQHFEVLSEVGSHQALPVLESMVSAWKNAPKKDAVASKADCVRFATAIIANWPSPFGHYGGTKESEPCSLLPLLAKLDEPELIREYLRNVVARDNGVEPGKPLATVCEKYGCGTFRTELEGVFRPVVPVEEARYHEPQYPTTRNARMLEELCLARPRQKGGWLELCAALAEPLITTLVERDEKSVAAKDYTSKRARESELVAGLVRSLIATEQFALLDRFVTHMLSTPQKYPLTEVHVAALTGLQSWLEANVKGPCPPLSRWIAACCEQLEALTAEMPQPPADLQRAANFSCKCADCQELRTFLSSPTEREHRFRMNEPRREHVESRIREGKCDVNCRTDKTSRPYTLVCTKNTASYEAALKKYHQDRKHLAALEAIQGKLAK